MCRRLQIIFLAAITLVFAYAFAASCTVSAVYMLDESLNQTNSTDLFPE